MSPTTLTPQQIAQAEYFDEKYTSVIPEIDFERYNRKRFGPWNPYWHLYNAVRELRTEQPQRLLNIGCGKGADALRYAKLGYAVEGIDISPRAVELSRAAAKRYGLNERAHFSVQPAESLSFPDGHFDVVVGINALHHMDTTSVIAETSRVLKPGGAAIFKEPLATPWRDRILHSPPFTWLVPKGTKSLPKGLVYGDSEGERNLDDTDFALMRSSFERFTIHRWRVLACLSVLVANRPMLERCDWTLFRMLPFLRRWGDHAVLIGEQPR